MTETPHIETESTDAPRTAAPSRKASAKLKTELKPRAEPNREAKQSPAPKKAPARAETKRDKLIKLLTRKGGAEVAAISVTLGWLPHTTRAALTGLRKAGFAIEAEKPAGGGASRYRIAARPAEPAQ